MSATVGICVSLPQYILISGNFMIDIITNIAMYISISLWSKPMDVPVLCIEYRFVCSTRRSIRLSSKNCFNYCNGVLSLITAVYAISHFGKYFQYWSFLQLHLTQYTLAQYSLAQYSQCHHQQPHQQPHQHHLRVNHYHFRLHLGLNNHFLHQEYLLHLR